MKNANELKTMSLDELQAELLELRKHQFTLRMKKANGSLVQTHPIKEARRRVARIKTAMTAMTEKKVGEKS